ncbi:hypothetical protein MMC21_005953 [Puttea exsequens]|nr:hypothetical protein [Puttea exsequens]
MAPLILLFSSVTFGPFWVVFRYNLLYVTVSRPNTRGLLYPTALNQLFTGVYVMDFCMIGLFFLVRDDHSRATCVGQAVIMIIATAMTLGFQILLNDEFAPLLRFLPQTEARGAEQEPKYPGTGKNSHLRTLIQECSKWLAPTKNPSLVDETFAGIQYKMEDSIPNEQDGFGTLAFQHESLCIKKPIEWILDDRLAISDNEISRISRHHSNVRVSNEHASPDGKGRVTITQNSSGFSEVESMKC